LEKKTGVFHEIIKPIIVLVAIAVVIVSALVVTNYFTESVIQENLQNEVMGVIKEIFPTASYVNQLNENFEPVDGVTIVSVYQADQGVAIITNVKGFGGTMSVMVGFTDGEIAKTVLLDNEESPGIGTQVGEDFFTERFVGQIPGEIQVDAIADATVSSNAFIKAVNTASDLYAELFMGGETGE